jgi:hypothetical protein
MCRIGVPTGADLNRFHSPLLKLVDHLVDMFRNAGSRQHLLAQFVIPYFDAVAP